MEDGGHDTTAGGHNVHVGGAADTHFEFSGTVTGPGDVGVGVNEAGEEAMVSGIEGVGGGILGLEVGAGADGEDVAVVDGDSAIGDDTKLAEVVAALGAAVIGDGTDLIS